MARGAQYVADGRIAGSAQRRIHDPNGKARRGRAQRQVERDVSLVQIGGQGADAPAGLGVGEGHALDLGHVVHVAHQLEVGGRDVLSAVLVEELEAVVVGMIVRGADIDAAQRAQAPDQER